jgi:predicted signal transduction protein with EAL and GGDEF domain
MGGDEFTVLLEDMTDPSDAVRVAERIQLELTKPFQVFNQEVFKSASIGIAMAPKDTSAENVVQNADIAMYRAKSKGKACSEIFDAAMHDQVMGRLQLEARLRRALENNELSLHYQPIVAVATGAVEGFEALLRWRPTGADSISPSVFIPAAERSGLIVPISTWVLATACLEAASWRRHYPAGPPLYVSINVSARHFSHPNFIGDLRSALEKSGIEPRHVKLELTESVAMNDAPSAEEIMSQIRALGVKLSIDDFGTGYSSLSYLRRFRVDTLKIDQSFVATMDVENYAIITTIIGLARNLGLDVVAEGVETVDQLEKPVLARCSSAQGYLFSKPLPADAVYSFVDSNRSQIGRAENAELASSSVKKQAPRCSHNNSEPIPRNLIDVELLST